MSNLSNSLENYLETIFKLCTEDNQGVRITDIAEKMNVSKASASKAMNNLASLGYITNEKYQLIFLTDEGTKIAHSMQHKHNAIKYFLQKSLNICNELADIEACKLEHIISDELFSAIERFSEKSDS